MGSSLDSVSMPSVLLASANIALTSVSSFKRSGFNDIGGVIEAQYIDQVYAQLRTLAYNDSP